MSNEPNLGREKHVCCLRCVDPLQGYPSQAATPAAGWFDGKRMGGLGQLHRFPIAVRPGLWTAWKTMEDL